MNLVPPVVLDLRIAQRDARNVHLWLPIVLLWPLGLALGIVAVVLTVLADIFLMLVGQKYHHYTLLLVRSFLALNETRGMVIRVNDGDHAVDITVL
ncbi:MAG: hypothetical protein HY876_01655 [Coriobacteriales bacterium]|nr:hypothetical protein [Coriobacteriales bacterium]